MIKRYSNEHEGQTVEAAPSESRGQGGAALLPERRRQTDLATHSERKPANVPPSDKADRVDWSTVLTWSLALFCFAAMFYTFYQIWAKFHGN